MKRRTVLKGLSVVAGGSVFSAPAWSALAIEEVPEPGTPLAMPIRGLLRKDGKLFQPIQMTIPHAGPSTSAVTKLNGIEVDRRTLTSGWNRFSIYAEPVKTPTNVTVDVTIGADVTSRVVKMDPVRQVKVYILPHSHHDLGYTDLQADVEIKQMDNITKSIELARATANYPEGARFVWNLEVLWGADQFMRRKSPAEQEGFIEAVKKGWVSLNGMYANELTGLCRPEELLQLFRYSSVLGKQCGVAVDSAMISDVPGYTWGTVTAMAQAGIRYFSAAPNWFDRIGRFMVEWQDKPFWWVSPSGKEKVLVWVPWTGYALSHVMKADREWVGKYQERLDSVDFPYNISYIRWSGHGDNASPDPEISEFVKSWSQEFEWPKFVISSTSNAFADFEKHHGNELPQHKGDLTPYWEDGAGSSALETRMSRNAADRLTQAETLAALLTPGAYQPAKFTEAWRNVLLYSEHTWGAWCSVSDSENPLTTKQWDVKREFAVQAEKQSEALLNDTLQRYANSTDNSSIDIHNSTSWPRTEVVVLSKTMSSAGDGVKDGHGKTVPSQRLSTGELAFLASEIPAFGSARFHISAARAASPTQAVSVMDGVLDNGIVRTRIDQQTGNIVQLTLHGKSENLIDDSGAESWASQNLSRREWPSGRHAANRVLSARMQQHGTPSHTSRRRKLRSIEQHARQETRTYESRTR
jgi:alpha-mannosidase